MFEADTAPQWAAGEVCHRCRVAFSTFTRQHHCRACGQVFCGKCSSKACVLPKFGIEREVRVCDSCFDQYGPKEEKAKKKQTSDMLAGYTSPMGPTNGTSMSNGTNGGSPAREERREEGELEKYLNREYWEHQSRGAAKQVVMG